MPRATFSQIVNRSMSEVITRSLVTSLSTLLPIVALMLFGGATLQDFGFALLIGVASGAYSSIFIAAPVLTHWKERETVWKRRERLVLEDHGGVIPAYAEGYLGEKETVAERAPRRRRRERTQPVAEPVAQATALEEPPAEPEPEPQPEPEPAPAPARPVAPVGRPRTPEERRAARRAARAAAQAADGERSPAEPPVGDGVHESKQKPKRQSGKKKHGRSR
jgi:SecD/SecF fusion protein